MLFKYLIMEVIMYGQNCGDGGKGGVKNNSKEICTPAYIV